MRALVLLMQLAVAQPQPLSQPQVQPPSRRDSTRPRARTDDAIREFLNVWTAAWMETQHRRPAMIPGEGHADDDERSMALHCHWDEGQWWLRKHIIPGALPAQPVCPRFLPRGA